MPKSLAITSGMFAAGLVLMYAQIALTRLMATAVGTHATFAILGGVMLGLAASGTRLHVHHRRDTQHTPAEAMIRAAGTGLVALFAFLALTAIPAIGGNVGLAILCAGVFVLPFYFVGYFITTVLETYTDTAPRLYAADLAGSALGAASSVALLDLLPPQSALLGVVAICAVVAVALDRRRAHVVVAGLSLAVFAASVAAPTLVELRYANRTSIEEIEWQKWDHIGNVAVIDAPEGTRGLIETGRFTVSGFDSLDDKVNLVALGWAMSRNYRGEVPETKYIRIDAGVGTPIVSRAVENTDVLAWDVTAAPFVMPESLDRVGIIGTGGGRDIQTARHFDAGHITALEINAKAIEATEVVYGDFSGKPYSYPNVELRLGDARSRVVGAGPFDMISLPMTDTYSASSSGTLVFTENALYTVEAFDAYLTELNDGGVLSMARFFALNGHDEITRLVATSRDAILRHGGDPASQVAIVYGNSLISETSGIANVLVKKVPFTEGELRRLREWAEVRGFSLLYPDGEALESFSAAAILSGDDSFYDGTHIDPSAIYDDRPFFYDTIRPIAGIVAALQTGDFSTVSFSVRALLLLLLVVAYAAKVLVIDPIRKSEDGPPRNHWSSTFFAAIGFGFLAVELAVIQRCTLFLGHPTYALTIVLSSLLISAAVGSWLSGRVAPTRLWQLASATVGVVIVSGIVQPLLLQAALHTSFGVRVVVVVALVVPLGITMGTLYSSALRLLSQQENSRLVPWCWAVNGTAGVIATIAGMFIAMRAGYTALFMAGALAYLFAITAARRAVQA